jgi:hypothetical protein
MHMSISIGIRDYANTASVLSETAHSQIYVQALALSPTALMQIF